MPRKVTKKIDDKYGRLKIIDNLGTRQEGNRGQWVRYYLCECECGNMVMTCLTVSAHGANSMIKML